jgi:hypothetical protein
MASYGPGGGLPHATSISSVGSMGGALQQPRKEPKLSLVFQHTEENAVRGAPGGSARPRGRGTDAGSARAAIPRAAGRPPAVPRGRARAPHDAARAARAEAA